MKRDYMTERKSSLRDLVHSVGRETWCIVHWTRLLLLLTVADDFDAFDTQQIAQHFHFSLQFANEFGIRIFVDDCLADDLFRTIRVSNHHRQHYTQKLLTVQAPNVV